MIFAEAHTIETERGACRTILRYGVKEMQTCQTTARAVADHATSGLRKDSSPLRTRVFTSIHNPSLRKASCSPAKSTNKADSTIEHIGDTGPQQALLSTSALPLRTHKPREARPRPATPLMLQASVYACKTHNPDRYMPDRAASLEP